MTKGIVEGLRDAIAYASGDETRGKITTVNVPRKWWPRNASEGFNGDKSSIGAPGSGNIYEGRSG